MSEQPPYEYQPFPAWYFGPEPGQKAIFQSEDEVPAGWADTPDAAERPASENLADDDDRVTKLVDENKVEDLIGMCEAMHEADDSFEFSKAWPKLKLAKAIVAAGGPLED